MSLAPGSRFGTFEIVSPLGAGGMGEVYRARDTRLDRHVAIKVLLDSFAGDADRLARFEREAKVLASLNHPHIAQIYGLVESPSTGSGQAAVKALVMEFVDGGTLADRISWGPVPLDEALPIARQIADALEAAHARGIVHRDLKPANVKLGADGSVKVLDFGLAKALDAGSAAGQGPAVSMSPTMTSPAMTQAGTILGTAAYMSPEQAKGHGVDERADIWAFGVVCWEMLNGRALFARESMSETLAAVLKEEPAWDRVPRSLRGLLEMCLAKDVKRRLRNAADVRLLLDQQLDQDVTRPVEAPPAPRRTRWAALVGAAALAAMLAGITVWVLAQPEPPGPVHLAVAHSGAEPIGGNDFDDNMALSPDGRLVAYVTGDPAVNSNTMRLYVRALDQPAPVLLSSSARSPFFSPDGQTIGFVEGNLRLSRVPAGGGPTVAIGGNANGTRGASWGDDGIVFATADQATGLMKISPADGQVVQLTRPDAAKREMDHVFPDVLPQGRGVLFTIVMDAESIEDAQIAVFDARTQKYKTLIQQGSHPKFVAPGYLLFGRGSSLQAVAFDLETLEVRGTPVRVMDGVASKPSGSVPFAVAANGTLAYFDNTGGGRTSTLVWLGADGGVEAVGPEPGRYTSPAVSPDGSRVAVSVEGATGRTADIWVWSVQSRTFSRLTFDAGAELGSLWTADGKRLVYESLANGATLMWRAADGTGTADTLLPPDPVRARVSPVGWTPDGRLVFEESLRGGEWRIGVVSPGSAPSVVMRETKFRFSGSSVSPDGRWLAYVSNESGVLRAYVRPFPDVNGGKWQVSTRSALGTRWSKDGRFLYLIGNSGLTAGTVTTSPSFVVSNLVPVLRQSPGFVVDFALAPDGRLMIVNAQDTGSVATLNVVLNWASRVASAAGSN